MAFSVKRIKGIVTSRRHFSWQVLNHKTLEIKLPKLSVLSAGIYPWIRVMAGNGRWDGSLGYGEIEQMKVRDLEEFAARRIGGDDWKTHIQAAKLIVKELRTANLIIWGGDRIVYAVDFIAEQFKPQTAGAARQRSRRTRQAGRNVDDESDHTDEPGGEPGGRGPAASAPPDCAPAPAAPSDAPPPPAPPSTSIPTESTSTRNRIGFGAESPSNEQNQGVTRDAQYRRIEDRKRDYRPFDFDPTRPGGAGGGGGKPTVPTSIDVYADDPVVTACRLTGEYHPWAVNSFRAALGRVSEGVFRSAMGQMKAALDSGVSPRQRADGSPGSRGAMLHGYIRANEEGRGG